MEGSQWQGQIQASEPPPSSTSPPLPASLLNGVSSIFWNHRKSHQRCCPESGCGSRAETLCPLTFAGLESWLVLPSTLRSDLMWIIEELIYFQEYGICWNSCEAHSIKESQNT